MTQLSSDSELSEIEAPIGYMVDTGVTPVFYQSNVPGERTKVEGTREKRIMKIMSEPPEWAPDLPIACEGDYANNYGDC